MLSNNMGSLSKLGLTTFFFWPGSRWKRQLEILLGKSFPDKLGSSGLTEKVTLDSKRLEYGQVYVDNEEEHKLLKKVQMQLQFILLIFCMSLNVYYYII